MDKTTKNNLFIVTLAGAVAIFLVLWGLIHAFGGAVTSEPLNGYTVWHPSVAHAANLGLNIAKIIMIILGSLIFGYAIASGLTNKHVAVAPVSTTNLQASIPAQPAGAQKVGVSIAEALGGILIILGFYLSAAYDIQTFTHITEKDPTVKHTNGDFHSKFQADPNPEFYKAAHGL